MTKSQDDLYKQPWEVLSEVEEFSARPWVHVVRQHVRLPNDVEIPDFYLIEAIKYVTIFALTDDHHVPMVEMYRHGVGRVALELPAGDVDDQQDDVTIAMASAKRELREETGFEAPAWHLLGRFFIDANRGFADCYAFLAIGAQQRHQPSLEDTEIMKLHLMDIQQVEEKWLNASIDNVAASATIGLALARLRQMELLP